MWQTVGCLLCGETQAHTSPWPSSLTSLHFLGHFLAHDFPGALGTAPQLEKPILFLLL